MAVTISEEVLKMEYAILKDDKHALVKGDALRAINQ
jgi:hypothetical protein